MTQAPPAAPSLYAAAGSGTEPAQMITRRLTAAGFGVHGTRWRDRHELILLKPCPIGRHNRPYPPRWPHSTENAA